MQEEVEKKSVDLAIRTSKVTVKTLWKGLKVFVNHAKNKSAKKKAAKEKTPIRGEQSVRDLIGQGQGVSTMPIVDEDLKQFKKTCNKYGVDFAIVKDKTVDPPEFTVFFKGKDADAIEHVLQKTSERLDPNKKKARPSILQKLKKFKEIVAKTPRKDKEKRKEQER